jgi:virulence-associated protein VapD
MLIDIDKLIPQADLINSEGSILRLYKDEIGFLYLSSRLNDGSGYIYFKINEEITPYVYSKKTLAEAYDDCESFVVQHKFKSDVSLYVKEDFRDKLTYAHIYYKDVPDDLKPEGLTNKMLK